MNSLSELNEIGGLLPAIVTKVEKSTIEIYLGAQQSISIPIESVKWAKPHVNENVIGKEPTDFTKMFVLGDVIRVVKRGCKIYGP